MEDRLWSRRMPHYYDEGWKYFERVVNERLGVSMSEFLFNMEKYRSSPNYDSVMFLLPGDRRR